MPIVKRKIEIGDEDFSIGMVGCKRCSAAKTYEGRQIVLINLEGVTVICPSDGPIYIVGGDLARKMPEFFRRALDPSDTEVNAEWARFHKEEFEPAVWDRPAILLTDERGLIESDWEYFDTEEGKP